MTEVLAAGSPLEALRPPRAIEELSDRIDQVAPAAGQLGQAVVALLAARAGPCQANSMERGTDDAAQVLLGPGPRGDGQLSTRSPRTAHRGDDPAGAEEEADRPVR